MPMKSNCSVSSSLSRLAAEVLDAARSYGRLTSPIRIASPDASAEERAQLLEEVVLVRDVVAGVSAASAEEERHGVDPEPAQPELEPEARSPSRSRPGPAGWRCSGRAAGGRSVCRYHSPVRRLFGSRCSSPCRGRRPCPWSTAACRSATRRSRGTGCRVLLRASGTTGACREVWLTTRSTITRMPRSRAVRITSTRSPTSPSRGSTP